MRRMTLVTALLVVAALAVPAGAQMQKEDQQDKGMEESSQRMAPQRQQVQGEIVEVRTVKVKQTKQDHLMGKVKLDTGQTAVLDFGPADKARESGLKFEKGQQIQAEGMVGQLNKKPVLIVTRAQQGSKTVNLNTDVLKHNGSQQKPKQESSEQNFKQTQMEQDSQKQDSQKQDSQKGMQDQSGQQGARPQMTQVQGQIMDVSTMKSDKDQQEHLVAEIRLQQTGQMVKADLGPADKARQSGLKLSQGQQIQVQGTIGRINDTPVVVVQRAQQDGKTVMLNAGSSSQQGDSQEQEDMQKKQDMQKQQSQ